MASTRYSPLEIYQDPSSSFDHAPMPLIRNSTTPNKSSPLRPIKNATSRRRNIVFSPPQAGPNKRSPLKSAQQTSSSPSRAPFGNKLNIISMPPPRGPSYNTDSIEKKPPLKPKVGPQKALFTTFPSTKPTGKENYPQSFGSSRAPYSDGLSANNFSLEEGLYGQKLPLKRTLMEAPSINESRPLKKPKVEEAQDGEGVFELRELPAPDSFPPLHDDGSKPAHSYAQLIGMSILRAPNRRLTLAQIYKWISDTYSFYNASEAGWQNSIRHNLSLNKAFIKQERPKDDPGKGNYWAIEPGMEHQFIKEKAVRKPPGPNENVPVLSTALTSVNPVQFTHSAFKKLSPASQELPPRPPYSLPGPQLPGIPELSSDATIPVSDGFVPEPEPEDEPEPPLSSPAFQSSPPAPLMHSSPPVPRHVPRRHDTPPPVPRFPSSSRSRSHKRKFTSMDDSGYFSSLDSSAMRPHNIGRLLTSEADRPRIKRGRAEEEIARLRGSSYDSPSKARGLSGFTPASSSPLRRAVTSNSTSMLPPLTPAVKLKAPIRPPQSVSPNTNLRMHRDRVRELVGSPVRGATSLEENLPWSPAFNLDENSYMFHDFNTDFDIFTDADTGLLSVPGNGSPEKRSAKRSRLDRSRSANILADISNSGLNKSTTSTPLLKFTPNLAPPVSFSPTKGRGLMESPIKFTNCTSPSKLNSPSLSIGVFDLHQEDFYGSEFLAEEMTEFSGVDIMQGFQKIGSGAPSSRNTPKNGSRPPMGRSFTSRF